MTEPDEDDDGWIIQYVDLDDLADADRNAKLHDVPAIMLSIGTLGFTEPLRIDERSGQLNAGHGRVTALRRMLERHDPVPEGIRETVNGWAVPVLRRWSSRSDEHAEAAATASNRIGTLAGNRPDVLADQLASIRSAGENLLRAAGYTPDAADELIHNAVQFRGFTPAPASPFAPRPDVDPWKPPPPPRFDPAPFPSVLPPEDRPAPKAKLSIVRDTDTPPPARPDQPEREHRPLPSEPGPGPKVRPAWRLLQPFDAVHYPGGPDGVDQVRRWAEHHGITDVDTAGDTGMVRVGSHHLDLGDWLLRDGEDGSLHRLTDERFHDRIIPANEPARRVQRAAETTRVVHGPGRQEGTTDDRDQP